MSDPTVIDSCSAYHRATSYDRNRMTPHYLDGSDVPRLRKSYPSPAAMQLIPGEALPQTPFWHVLGEACMPRENVDPDLAQLSRMLSLAYGVTAQQRIGGQMYRYRSVPSAGALYPAEVYLASPGFSGVSQGLWYYDIDGFSLIELRNEDPGILLLKAMAAGERRMRKAWVMISGIFYRSAWKYRNRAFRYVLLDIGHLIENFHLVLKLFGQPHAIHYDFDDASLGRLLGLDVQQEACFSCVNWGMPAPDTSLFSAVPEREMPLLSQAHRCAGHTADRETRYPEIEAIYRISSRQRRQTGAAKAPFNVLDQTPDEAWFPLLKSEGRLDREMTFVASVHQRRSRRSFIPEPLSAANMMRLLELLCLSFGGEPDEGDTQGALLVTGFLAGRVEGFDPGFYLLGAKERSYRRVKAGRLTEKMASVCLDQQWLKLAAVHFLFMANLREIDRMVGTRGYRHALMHAGRSGQRLYLGATALNLGCCGIGALYDAEARALLSLNEDSALLYLAAVGPVVER